MRKVIIVVTIVMLLITGCSSRQEYEKVNYFEGDEGLVFSFIDNSPPLKVYPEQTIPVTVDLKNIGSFSLAKKYPETYLDAALMDEMYASAMIIYDSFYLDETDKSKRSASNIREKIFLEGKSASWPSGESRIVTLGLLRVRNLSKQRVGAETDITVSMCFPYESLLTAEVCVGTDVLSERAQPCEIESLSFVDQGAPIAITHVDVASIPMGTTTQELETSLGESYNEIVMVSKPVFRLVLENVGSGQLIRGRDHEDYKSCLKKVGESMPSNSAKVVAYLGNKQLVCSPEVPVFVNNQAEVSCTLQAEDEIVTSVNYLDILQIYVDYVYQIRESVTIEIDDTFKQYVSPEHLEFTCMDFDFNKDECTSNLADYDLTCYYCEANHKCFAEDQCSQCNGGVANETTRTCVQP